MAFKASKDLNVEGNKQIITREPGIYVVSLDNVEEGVKRVGTGDAAVDVPTIDYTVVVRKVTELHDKTLDAQSIVGKKHMEQIRLDGINTQEDFNKKYKRIAHIFTKAGVPIEDIQKVPFDSPEQYQKAIVTLYDREKHGKATFNYRVIGGTYNGAVFTQAPGYLGFATVLGEEQKFSSSEIKANNDYYSALKGQTPSAETGGIPSDGGSVPAGAF